MGNYAHYKSRRKNSKSVIACKYGVGRYIYVVEVAAQGRRYVKVGTAKEVVSRISSVQCGCPVSFSGAWFAPVMDEEQARLVERYLHAVLGRWHERGEWFDAGADEGFWAVIAKASDEMGVPLHFSAIESTDLAERPTKPPLSGAEMAALADRIRARQESLGSIPIRSLKAKPIVEAGSIRMAEVSAAYRGR